MLGVERLLILFEWTLNAKKGNVLISSNEEGEFALRLVEYIEHGRKNHVKLIRKKFNEKNQTSLD
jgi:hypothetical protein